ncbi:MAG: DUF2207 domain-containing protein [Patescibacteria group bacterium]
MNKKSAAKVAKRRSGLIGFYSRKFIFFCGVFLLAFLAFNFIQTNKYSADVESINIGNSNQNSVISVSVDDNGIIRLNGKNVGKTELVNGYDEIRLPVLDNGGEYYDQLKILLSLPKGSAYKTKHEILAIHGVGSTQTYVNDPDTIEYDASQVSAYATITIVAQIPKGVINHPIIDQIINFFRGLEFNVWLLLALVLPIITFLYMTFFLRYLYRINKIDSPDREISAPPMALPPAIVGALFRGKVGSREIAATLIDLARRKDIVILDRERGFAFSKGRFDDRLLGYEKILLSKIFRNNLTSDRAEIERRINNHLYSKKMSIVSAGIYAITTRLGYFKVNPRSIHAKYRLIGILTFLFGLTAFILSLRFQLISTYSSFFWVGMMVSALIVAFSASNIPLRTQIGNEALSNWLAFKKFLSNPKPIPYTPTVIELFEAYLPYAIVLDCEVEWAKRFEEHNFIIPEWFLTDKVGLGLDEFCLSLFPIVSYVARSFAALREPGFE